MMSDQHFSFRAALNIAFAAAAVAAAAAVVDVAAAV